MRKLIIGVACAFLSIAALGAQEKLKRVYDENVDPFTQIDSAVKKAASSGKYVICQLGGNWCVWCLRFADFISRDEDISKVIDDNFVYIHVNYNPRQKPNARTGELLKRLNHADRFGFPVFVVLDGEGNVIHIQDSGYLEKEMSYDKGNVMRFFVNWTPKAVRGE